MAKQKAAKVAPETVPSDPAAPADPSVEFPTAEGQTAGNATAEVPTPAPLFRLEQARSLPELPRDESDGAVLVSEGIQSFKDADRRTMNVVAAGGRLYKQEL